MSECSEWLLFLIPPYCKEHYFPFLTISTWSVPDPADRPHVMNLSDTTTGIQSCLFFSSSAFIPEPNDCCSDSFSSSSTDFFVPSIWQFCQQKRWLGDAQMKKSGVQVCFTYPMPSWIFIDSFFPSQGLNFIYVPNFYLFVFYTFFDHLGKAVRVKQRENEGHLSSSWKVERVTSGRLSVSSGFSGYKIEDGFIHSPRIWWNTLNGTSKRCVKLMGFISDC